MSENNHINCETVSEKLSAYLEGQLEENVTHLLEEHLNTCSVCKKKFDDEDNKMFVGGIDSTSYDVKKIESRFTWRILGKIARICVVIVVALYAAFTMILPMIFNKTLTEKLEYSRYAVNDIIQFTIPGAKIKNIPTNGRTSFTNSYYITEFEKRLDGGGMKSGRIDLAIPLYLGTSDFRMTWSLDGQGSDITFKYPQPMYGQLLEEKWDKLSNLKNGTKTYLAAYFEKSISLQEMEKLLNTIDADDPDTWLAIDTGNLKFKEHYSTGKLNYRLEWGFPMSILLTPATADEIYKDERGLVTSMTGGNPVHSVTVLAEKFKKEMKDFQKYSKVLGMEDFETDVKLINEYLASNEIKIKGAILAASTTNMLKLKEENIVRIDILKVDFDY